MPTDIETYKLAVEKRWTEVEVKAQKLLDADKTIFAKLEEHSKQIADIQQLSTSVAILASNMEAMLKEQQEQNKRLQQLEQKPAKRWDIIVDKILSVIVASLVGYMLIKLGIQG